MKKNFLKILAFGAIGAFIFSSCSNPWEIEEEQQIKKINFLSERPTYYVASAGKVTNEERSIIVHRKEFADGTLDSVMVIKFDLQSTPSARYIKDNDSLKLDITVINDEKKKNGRFVNQKHYESYLFVFVDQIPILKQKNKERFKK